MEGWEISSDRIKKYEKMMAIHPIGDPIITSKCQFGPMLGFLIVSDNGIFCRGLRASSISKWVGWHDVANIIPIKNGKILVEIKRRKKGTLILDEKGNYKKRRWGKIIIKRNMEVFPTPFGPTNKVEQNANWKQRLESFNDIMLKIFNQNKVKTDPVGVMKK